MYFLPNLSPWELQKIPVVEMCLGSLSSGLSLTSHIYYFFLSLHCQFITQISIQEHREIAEELSERVCLECTSREMLALDYEPK